MNTPVTLADLRDMARDMSGVNRWGVARISATGEAMTYSCQNGTEAYMAEKLSRVYAIALNGVVIDESDRDAPVTYDTPQTPELAPLVALSDADLKARYDAAWALVLAYGEEIRRRADADYRRMLNSDEIPF